jgi:thiamine pyrophosphokinase
MHLDWPLNSLVTSSLDSSPLSGIRDTDLGGCIILNAPAVSRAILINLFTKSKYRLCADGGANVLYDLCPSISIDREESLFWPDVVIGDLDSIRTSVEEFFRANGVKILRMDNEDLTDLDKALDFLTSLIPSHDQLVAIVGSVGSHEGRIDQMFAVIQTMFRYRGSYMRLVQIGSECIMLVLNAGEHRIEAPSSSIGKHCGIIPVFGSVDRITTTGLQWNLTESHGSLEFGGLISTNNIIRNELIQVDTSGPVLFTIAYG